MNIYCPYTRLQTATEITLRIEEPQTKFIYVGHSEVDYYMMMLETWLTAETFIIVEHDIVIYPGALKSLWSCPCEMCAYEAPNSVSSKGLGCLKYDKKLMQRFPNLLQEAVEGEKSWRHADKVLTFRLQSKGVGIHYHQPPVSHINPLRFAELHPISGG